jgi:hypothetical protein
MSETVIRNHCDEARNNAQLAVEEAYQKIDEIKNDFLDQIDNYESVCQRKLQSSLPSKENGSDEKTFDEVEKFCENAETCLKSYSIDSMELKSLLSNGNNLLDRIEKLHFDRRYEIFDGIQLKFTKKELAPDTIGCIKRQHLDIFYLNKICTVKEIDFTTRFTDIKKDPVIRNFYFMPILNQNYLIVYQNEKNNLNFVELDNLFALRTSRKNVISSSDIPFFKLFVCSDVFFIFTVEKILEFEILISSVYIFY